MKFKKIKIKNIRSYIEQEIEFPEGSLLLSGEIGSGKTSILLALEYALFGLQPGQKGSSLLRNKKDIGEVLLEIDLGGKLVVVERKLKRSSRGISNEQSSIIVDGKKIESSTTEIKSKIVSILGYPPELIKKNNILYRYTVFSPQEQMKQIILEDSETRLNILRHIFGIDKYKLIKDNLGILVNKIKLEVKLLQAELKNSDVDKESLEFRKMSKERISKELINTEEEIGNKIIEKNKIENDIIDLEKKIEEKRNFTNELEKAKVILTNKKENLNSLRKEKEEIARLLQSLPEFSNENHLAVLARIREVKLSFDRLNSNFISIEGKIKSLEEERAIVVQKKDRIFRIDLCPTCLQNVSENHKHNIQNEVEKRISEIKKELEKLGYEKIELEKEVHIQKNILSDLEERKIEFEILKSKQEYHLKTRSKLTEIEKTELILDNDVGLIFQHLDSLRENIQKYSIFDNKYRIASNALKTTLEELRTKEIISAELKKELELNNKEIIFLERKLEKMEIIRKKIYNLTELVDWLSGQFLKLIDFTERNVLLKLRNEFSIIFRKWFLMLIPENTLDVRIDENFTPIIIQKETEMDFDFLSGGERTAVALAYRLALNQIINSIFSKIKTKGIIILDEPTDGFSEEQINKIREILEELNAQQLIIVSHEQKIESFVDNIFKITKEGDISTIKTGD